MVNQIICYSCKKEIKTNKDLVTAVYFFRIKPFHLLCYSKVWERYAFFPIFLNSFPITHYLFGKMYTILMPIFGVFLLFLSLSGESLISLSLIVALCFIILPISIKLYSYYKYEKQLS